MVGYRKGPPPTLPIAESRPPQRIPPERAPVMESPRARGVTREAVAETSREKSNVFFATGVPRSVPIAGSYAPDVECLLPEARREPSADRQWSGFRYL